MSELREVKEAKPVTITLAKVKAVTAVKAGLVATVFGRPSRVGARGT